MGNLINMFKDFFRFDLEYKEFFNSGTVDKVLDSNVVSIKKEEWAPGIWAGTEGMKVYVYSSEGKFKGDAEVEKIDLNDRVINFLSIINIEPNDTLHFLKK